jgi:hypothetical protein
MSLSVLEFRNPALLNPDEDDPPYELSSTIVSVIYDFMLLATE